jgi:hypothetical protein
MLQYEKWLRPGNQACRPRLFGVVLCNYDDGFLSDEEERNSDSLILATSSP